MPIRALALSAKYRFRTESVASAQRMFFNPRKTPGKSKQSTKHQKAQAENKQTQIMKTLLEHKY